MTLTEFKGWIESLVNQISDTDWWSNGIAIFCAIIGVTVPIIYEMYQRKKGDNKINTTIKESLEELSLISKELKEKDDTHSSDIKYLIRMEYRSQYLYKKLLQLFEVLDELIFLGKNEKDFNKIVRNLEEIKRILSRNRFYREPLSYRIENLKELVFNEREISNYFIEEYIKLKYQIFYNLD